MGDFIDRFGEDTDEWVADLEEQVEAARDEPAIPDSFRAVDMTFDLLREALS